MAKDEKKFPSKFPSKQDEKVDKLEVKPGFVDLRVASNIYSGKLGDASQEQLRSLVKLNKSFNKWIA